MPIIPAPEHPGPEGLRERRNRETRRKIHHCALELAEQHGVAALTIAMIAERAGVSRRTFFRYFSNREQAILPGHRRYLDAVAALQPSATTLAEALAEIEILGDYILTLDGDQELDKHRRVSALIVAHPPLRAYASAQDMEIAEKLADRFIPSLPHENPHDVALLADIAIATWRRGWIRWSLQAEGRPAETPVQAHRAARATLRRLLDSPAN